MAAPKDMPTVGARQVVASLVLVAVLASLLIFWIIRNDESPETNSVSDRVDVLEDQVTNLGEKMHQVGILSADDIKSLFGERIVEEIMPTTPQPEPTEEPSNQPSDEGDDDQATGSQGLEALAIDIYNELADIEAQIINFASCAVIPVISEPVVHVKHTHQRVDMAKRGMNANDPKDAQYHTRIAREYLNESQMECRENLNPNTQPFDPDLDILEHETPWRNSAGSFSPTLIEIEQQLAEIKPKLEMVEECATNLSSNDKPLVARLARYNFNRAQGWAENAASPFGLVLAADNLEYTQVWLTATQHDFAACVIA